MIRSRNLDDLAMFQVVSRCRSFTRAAGELGMSTSNLSHAMRRLEISLGVRLLQRNSRSVAPSAAGNTLLAALGPALQQIDDALDALQSGADRVTGTLRLTATREGFEAIIQPVLPRFTEAYPDATIDVSIDYGLRDIIAEGLDAGIRLGEKVAQDMIAIPMGKESRMAVVASPAYVKRHGQPFDPRALTEHRCINYRWVTAGSLYPWEFEKDGKAVEVRVSGPFTVNEPELMLQAALDGLGIAYVFEERAAPFLATGELVRFLVDWTPPFPGFFLYYPSRKQTRPALAAFITMAREAAPRRQDEIRT